MLPLGQKVPGFGRGRLRFAKVFPGPILALDGLGGPCHLATYLPFMRKSSSSEIDSLSKPTGEKKIYIYIYTHFSKMKATYPKSSSQSLARPLRSPPSARPKRRSLKSLATAPGRPPASPRPWSAPPSRWRCRLRAESGERAMRARRAMRWTWRAWTPKTKSKTKGRP